MEAYIGPVVFGVSIGIFLWLQGVEGRQVPYKEPLVSKDFLPVANSPSEKNIVWILRNYTVESRLYRMIQYIGSQYGIPQVVIVPNESKVSLGGSVPILEFFQKTEIAVAMMKASHVFSEPGVVPCAETTARRGRRPLGIFVHDRRAQREVRSVKNEGSVEIFYTSRSVQDEYADTDLPSFQFYLPVFMKEHVTHTTRERVVCFCREGRWKFQRIAGKLRDYAFFYGTFPNFREAGILCIIDGNTPYELGLRAAASQIPVICQWTPVFEEVFGDYVIYIRSDSNSEWEAAIARLKEEPLWYRDWSRKALKLSQMYDSPKEMDMFLNYVFSGKLISKQ